MAHWRKTLRRTLQRFGYDMQRIGARQLGRDHIADIRLLCTGQVQTIFDVGANVGQAAIGFADAYPEATIYSFEPFPETYTRLVSNVSAQVRVRPQNMAVGESNATAVLNVNRGSELNSLLMPAAEAPQYIDQSRIQTESTCPVSVTTLDGFCRERGIPKIDLLKIDTQGFELQVLKGSGQALAAGKIRAIFLEINFVPLYQGQPSFGEISAYLAGYGCRFVSFYEPAFHERGYLKWADALFVRPAA